MDGTPVPTGGVPAVETEGTVAGGACGVLPGAVGTETAVVGSVIDPADGRVPSELVEFEKEFPDGIVDSTGILFGGVAG